MEWGELLMAYDKAVDSAVLDAGLTAIANAIREKGGTSDPIAFDAMANAIAAIEGGGGVATGTVTLTAANEVVTIEHGLGEIPSVWAVYIASSEVNANEILRYENLITVCFLSDMNYEGTDSSYNSYCIYANNAGSVSNYSLRARTGLYISTTIKTETAGDIKDPSFISGYISYINKNFMKIIGEDSSSLEGFLRSGITYNWVVA